VLTDVTTAIDALFAVIVAEGAAWGQIPVGGREKESFPQRRKGAKIRRQENNQDR
jgi:hypothetical protein